MSAECHPALFPEQHHRGHSRGRETEGDHKRRGGGPSRESEERRIDPGDDPSKQQQQTEPDGGPLLSAHAPDGIERTE